MKVDLQQQHRCNFGGSGFPPGYHWGANQATPGSESGGGLHGAPPGQGGALRTLGVREKNTFLVVVDDEEDHLADLRKGALKRSKSDSSLLTCIISNSGDDSSPFRSESSGNTFLPLPGGALPREAAERPPPPTTTSTDVATRTPRMDEKGGQRGRRGAAGPKKAGPKKAVTEKGILLSDVGDILGLGDLVGGYNVSTQNLPRSVHDVLRGFGAKGPDAVVARLQTSLVREGSLVGYPDSLGELGRLLGAAVLLRRRISSWQDLRHRGESSVDEEQFAMQKASLVEAGARLLRKLTPLIPRTPPEKGGELTSIGSIGHAQGSCQRCLLASHNVPCRYGLLCEFCHMPHFSPGNHARPCKGKRERFRKLEEDSRGANEEICRIVAEMCEKQSRKLRGDDPESEFQELGVDARVDGAAQQPGPPNHRSLEDDDAPELADHGGENPGGLRRSTSASADCCETPAPSAPTPQELPQVQQGRRWDYHPPVPRRRRFGREPCKAPLPVHWIRKRFPQSAGTQREVGSAGSPTRAPCRRFGSAGWEISWGLARRRIIIPLGRA